MSTYFVGPSGGIGQFNLLECGEGNYVEQVQIGGADTITSVSILIAPVNAQAGSEPSWLQYGEFNAPILGTFSVGTTDLPTITAMGGTYSDSVTSLTFYFSDGSQQTFGAGGGENDFMYDVPGGATFSGFCGTGLIGQALSALGLALTATSSSGTSGGPCICMGPAGAAGGTRFVDPPLPPGATVQSLQIYADTEVTNETFVKAIGLTYEINGSVVQLPAHGDASGTLQTLTLQSGEFVTGIQGYFDTQIRGIILTTNQRNQKYGLLPFLGTFNFQVPPGASNVAIGGLAGRCDNSGLYALGCIGLPNGTSPPATSAVYAYTDSAVNAYCYSTSQTAPSTSYASQGVSFYAFSQQLIGTVPVYSYLQSSSGQYFYALSDDAAPGSDWALQPGAAFYVYDASTAPSGSISLNLYGNSSNQYQCATSQPSGYQTASTLGNVFRPVVPINCYANSSGMHFYCQSTTEVVPDGYTVDTSDLFYVFGDPVFGTIPIYCYLNTATNAYAYVAITAQLPGGATNWVPQSIAWYCYPNTAPGSGAVAVLNYLNSTTGDAQFALAAQNIPGYTEQPATMFAFASATAFQSISIPDAIIVCSGDSLYSSYLPDDSGINAGLASKAPVTLDAEDSSYVSASSHWWGLTLQLSSKAVSDLQSGIDITSGVTGALAVVAGLTGNVPVAALAGVITAGLQSVQGVLGLFDRGKGIYTFYTWAQIPLYAYGMYALPVPWPVT